MSRPRGYPSTPRMRRLFEARPRWLPGRVQSRDIPSARLASVRPARCTPAAGRPKTQKKCESTAPPFHPLAARVEWCGDGKIELTANISISKTLTQAVRYQHFDGAAESCRSGMVLTSDQ